MVHKYHTYRSYKSQKFFMENSIRITVLISEFSLFRSSILNGKNEFRKSSVLRRKRLKQPGQRCDL